MDYKKLRAEQIRRGSIVYVRNGSKETDRKGHLTAGDRPAVIIQNDKGNQFSPNLIVCFLTSKCKRLEMATHVLIQHYEGLCPSVIQTEQIVTIRKEDVIGVLGKLRPEDEVRLDAAVKASLGLEG